MKFMRAQINLGNIPQLLIGVIVIIVILYIFLGLVFPAMCHAGITTLCGI